MLQFVVQICLKICHQLLLFVVVDLWPNHQNLCKHLWNSKRGLPIEVDSVKLRKIPIHLAISIGSETKVNYIENGNVNTPEYLDKIAEVVYWASVFNIRYLSLYDPKGFLKSHSKILCQQLMNKFVLCSFKSANQIVCTKIKTKYQEKNSEDHITIFVRCRQDGKKLMLQAIRDIYLDNKMKAAPPTQITNEIFDDHLNQIMYSNLWVNMDTRSTLKTDPDLLMILGETKSLKGFLPWHIRNTEIHVLPNLLDLDQAKFVMSIQKYANCEQRFGK